MTATRRQSGFTLLEVMLAVLLIAIVTGSLYAAFTATTRARRSAEASVEAARTAHLALQAIASDLAGAVQTSATALELFLGEDGGDRDSLAFHANTGLAHVRNGQGSDVVFVRYELTEDNHLVRRTTHQLLSQTEPLLDEQTLAANVTAFDVRYHDGADWLDDWDALLRDGELPAAVDVAIEITRDGVARRSYAVALLPAAAAQTEQVTR